MSIGSVSNLTINSVRRSGTQLDIYCSSNRPLLRTEPAGAVSEAINISRPNGVKTEALCILEGVSSAAFCFSRQT
jgi:hypothetical protein